MTLPISDPAFWRQRIAEAREPHRALFECSLETWKAIEEKHREILAEVLKPKFDYNIIDCGCGWGRLIDLLPIEWLGNYYGTDVSPDFIERASTSHTHRRYRFARWDMRRPMRVVGTGKYDLAILVSIRTMVKQNLGEETWVLMERNIREVAERLLYLEYDANNEGSLE